MEDKLLSIDLAERLFREEEYEMAFKIYQTLATKDKYNKNILWGLAMIFCIRLQFEVAEKLIRKITDIAPQDSNSWVMLFLLLRNRKDCAEEAKECILNAGMLHDKPEDSFKKFLNIVRRFPKVFQRKELTPLQGHVTFH